MTAEKRKIRVTVHYVLIFATDTVHSSELCVLSWRRFLEKEASSTILWMGELKHLKAEHITVRAVLLRILLGTIGRYSSLKHLQPIRVVSTGIGEVTLDFRFSVVKA